MTPAVYYLNGDFDLRLAGQAPQRLARLVSEMTLWYVPCAQPHDTVIVTEPLPQAHADYLTDAGIELPRVVHKTADCSARIARPWGWDSPVVALMRTVSASLDYPDLETVKRINGRAFAYDIARRLGCVLPDGCKCHDLADVKQALAASTTWPRVIKPRHGNAGIGLRVIRGPEQVAAALTHATALFAAGNGPVWVEPWLERSHDLSVRFTLARDGTMGEPVLARARVSSSGAAYAVVEGRADPSVRAYADPLRGTATDVAAAIAETGYWGPVNIDAMVARCNGTEQLFPLIEINARDSMSRLAASVARKLPPCPWRQLRTVSLTRRAHLPANYPALCSRLGPAAFDPHTGRGILMLTPLHLSEPPRPPHRAIFYLAAQSEEQLAHLDRRLSEMVRRESP